MSAPVHGMIRQRSFLATQFSYLFSTWRGRQSLWHRLRFYQELVELPLYYARLKWALRTRPPTFGAPGKTCVVVLLSHNRPYNMDLIARAVLKNGFVRKLIISNSNADIRLAEWIRVIDPRLVLIDETEPTQPGHRFVLAAREDAEFFLSVDDDIFLTPRQWAAYFARLIAAPQVPHGIIGNFYRPGTVSSNGSPFHHVARREISVDVLVSAHAFTREHVQRVHALASALGIAQLSGFRNGEDLLMSFAGTTAPRIHDLGPLFCCASASIPGVALWKSGDNFNEERVRLFEQLKQARPHIDAPWTPHTA